ncbi:Nitroreductase [Bifidobacterium stellenboschense]|uniref:Nitroreductase n=2 Tax=Bifidobacterium stellenboschense TaxID=762211 RepID=A0A087DMS4_9BIFI|nr:Nitroreductase [Bifidobacterium stellenboschense]
MGAMVTNSTIETLLNRRSIRAFKDEAIDDDTRITLETVAQRAASSQYLNDWSAIRISDPAIKAKFAEFGHQPYIAQAPLLYLFIIDEHRNALIAERKGVDTHSDAWTLTSSYRFTQAQNDAVLALHAMETAANSLGLGCVILGSVLNDIPGLIEVCKLPEYTYPVLAIAIGKPDQEPALKPRMPRTMQFFENTYPADDSAAGSDAAVLSGIDDFDATVHKYYDLRNTDRPVDAFSDQIAKVGTQDVSGKSLLPKAAAQGFRLDR